MADKGDMTSVGTNGWWISGAAADYPDEDEVKAGIEYGNGSYTGTYTGAAQVVTLETDNPTITVEAT